MPRTRAADRLRAYRRNPGSVVVVLGPLVRVELTLEDAELLADQLDQALAQEADRARA